VIVLAAVPYAIVAAAPTRAPSPQLSPRSTATQKPSANSGPATPHPDPTLTEADQYKYDVEREENRHWEVFGADVGSLVRDVSWPIAAIVLVVLAARAMRQFTRQPDAPNTGKQGGVGIPLPGDFAAVASADQQRAVTAIPNLIAAAAGVGKSPTPAALMNTATRAIVAPAQQPAFAAAQDELSQYFQRVYSSMQATQLQLMRALALRPLNLGDVNAYYGTSVQRGYTRRSEDWLDLPVRFALVERQTDGSTSPYTTTFALSELGKLYVGWCDANSLSDRTLEAEGRGF
jgi:hypothetical protein